MPFHLKLSLAYDPLMTLHEANIGNHLFQFHGSGRLSPASFRRPFDFVVVLLKWRAHQEQKTVQFLKSLFDLYNMHKIIPSGFETILS